MQTVSNPESTIAILKVFEDDMKILAPSQDHSNNNKFSQGFECILENYRGTFQDTSIYNRTLLKKLEELTKDLQESREREKYLEKKLLAYNEHHPSGFINRRHFDTYMITTRDRISTNEEWIRFTKTYSFNTDPMTISLYKWIDDNI